MLAITSDQLNFRIKPADKHLLLSQTINVYNVMKWLRFG